MDKPIGGFSLATVLLVAILLIMLLIALIQFVPGQFSFLSGPDNTNNAILVAEAGIQHAIDEFEEDPNWIEALRDKPLQQEHIDAETGIDGVYILEIENELDNGSFEIKSIGWQKDDPGTKGEAKAVFSVAEEITVEKTITETTETVEVE